MTDFKVNSRLSSLILYLFGFLLLWEWIRPVEQLTDTSNVWVFLLFLLIALFLDYIGLHYMIRFILKGGVILFALYMLYYTETLGPFQSLSIMIEEFFYNFSVMLQRDWPELTNMFRSFLFFVLLWLMTYLIQYWLINRRQIFVFFLMTLIYITVLDTFTPYNAEWAIVRTVVSGFLIMGILTFYRELEKEEIKKGKAYTRKWMIPLISFLFASFGLAYAAPKADPIWPDPVPFITSLNEESGGSPTAGIRKIGYGEDDSNLGGPFLPDNKVVFEAEMEFRHYWKVETKDVYTGKGWVPSAEGEEKIPFSMGEETPIESFVDNGNVETTEHSSFVQMLSTYPHVMYPLGVTTVDGDRQYSMELNPTLEKIETPSSNPGFVTDYSVSYERPSYSVTALSASNNENHGLDSEFYERYTQLPDNLPQRIHDLAAEIVANSDNWFDQIREIERYFSRSGYIYDQRDVAIPGPNDDYVDQFLFHTRRGYCDNFSTSMVVLARSAGIPTRWVKGYTEGEMIASGTDDRNRYEITNNNAHSWVEAYFPEVGWVSFEPTQGFTNSVQYNFDMNDDNNSSQQQEETPDQPNAPELDENRTPTDGQSDKLTITAIWDKVKDVINDYWKIAAGILAILTALIAAAYYKRGRWLPYFYTWWFKRSKKDEQFIKAYLTLLNELERYGLAREKGQTLREYSKVIDHSFETKDMSRLTAKYEQYLYRGSLEKGIWIDTQKLWENLIKKTIA